MKGNGQNIHELTRIEAYLLSEKAGHPAHMHDYFWAQAEAIVRQRVAAVNFAVKTTGAKISKTAKPKGNPAAPKAKKMPAAPLPVVHEPVAAKPKTVAPSKKKVAATPAKAPSKKAAKSK